MKKWKLYLSGSLIIIALAVLVIYNIHLVKSVYNKKYALANTKVIADNLIKHNFEDNLVYLKGNFQANEILKDVAYNVNLQAPKIKRSVEVLQWQNIKKIKDKSTIIKKSEDGKLAKIWSEELINSKKFGANFENPTQFSNLKSEEFISDNVSVGEFRLTKNMIETLQYDKNYQLKLQPTNLEIGFIAYNGYFIKSATPANPTIGDVRIIYKGVENKIVTILAKQKNNSFEKFKIPKGENILFFTEGDFDLKRTINKVTNFRWVEIIKMFASIFLFFALAFRLLFKNNESQTDFISRIRNAIGSTKGILLCALSCILLITGLIWVIFLPIYGGIILSISFLLIVFFLVATKKTKPAL